MRFSELDGKTIGVWGVGRETRSLVSHLTERSPAARVAVLVREQGEETLPVAGLRVVTAADAVSALSGCDVLVRSPGVSVYRDEVRELLRMGVAVTTGTALWIAERKGRRVIGVTGTKGKSTTATFAHYVAGAGGHRVHLAGNIGRPALDLLDVPDEDWAIVELSSYQISDLVTGPEIAVATNVYKEHTDWHVTEDAYRRDKLRVFSLPSVRVGVVPGTAPELVSAAALAPTTVLYDIDAGWHVADGDIWLGPTRRLEQPKVPGLHNRLNLCAALAALGEADLLGADLEALAADTFPMPPHRLQTVIEADGIEWVDDSISTTPESALAAMAAFPDKDVILIGGGLDRGQQYSALGREAAARGAAVIGLPVTGERLIDAAVAAGVSPDRAFTVPDMTAAVSAARRLASTNTAVLLTPAAPSYNTYRNFEERGDHFASLARASGK